MAKFRKRPVVIEAEQFDGSVEVAERLSRWSDGKVFVYSDDGTMSYGQGLRIGIFTLEGTHIAQAGDWIIRGVKGEYYPCKPDIFEATYETVEE